MVSETEPCETPGHLDVNIVGREGIE